MTTTAEVISHDDANGRLRIYFAFQPPTAVAMYVGTEDVSADEYAATADGSPVASPDGLRQVPVAVDDANTPPFLPVKTNMPGPLPDGKHTFLSGEAAIAQMTVADGMKVELVASEEMFPEVVNPVQMAFDTKGRLWIATDGNDRKRTGRSDGLWAIETEGQARATSKLFFRCPQGAELCGPEFTPDDTTLFLAVQHPGEDTAPDWAAKTFGSYWPANQADPTVKKRPRSATVVITRKDGGEIGI